MERQPITHLTGNEGEVIDFETAINWTKNYREKHPGETLSQFFGKSILEKVLAQEDCLGIRFYYAHDKPLSGWQRFIVSVSNFFLKVVGNIDGGKHLVIVGAMKDGMDQLPSRVSTPPGQPVSKEDLKLVASAPVPTPIVGEQSMPCPGSPGCPKNLLSTHSSEL
jgi:hypothetical protein